MTANLTNRVALVTGASRGLGAAIARSLADAGARVAINYFGNAEGASRIAADIREAGGEAEAFRADVRSSDDVRLMTADIAKRLGPVDILVLNATGPQPFVKIEDLTWQAFVDQFEFFIKSPMLLLQAVVGQMKQRKFGRVINIGSEVFECGVPEFSNYVAAKGAQLGLTRSWAMELAPWQITVNQVSPGWIPTERHAGDSRESKAQYAASIPMKRMGVPPDIGAAVAFLASDGANFITGQKISVNGGNTLE